MHHLDDFINKSDGSFEKIFDEISCAQKDDNKQLLKYIYSVLSNYETSLDTELSVLHFHFEEELEDPIKQLIAEFLIITLFNKFSSFDDQTNNTHFTSEENKLRVKAVQRKLMACPDGASGKNGGNKIFKNWQNEKNRMNALLKFYEKFDEPVSLKPSAIFNCQIKLQKRIVALFALRPFAIEVENGACLDSSIILNTESLNLVKKRKVNEQYLLKLIQTVILYDSENSVKRFGEFNLERLRDLNRNHGTSFKSLILFSFGNGNNSINEIREKIDLVKDRFKLPDYSAYTLLACKRR